MIERPEPSLPKWPLEKQIEFHLKEYEFLKAEIARLDTAKRVLQIYTVGGVAGVTAWLVSNNAAIETLGAAAFWWLPVVMTIFGAIISRTYVKSAKEIGDYIRTLERVSAFSNLGWEHRINERRRFRGGLTTPRETIVWSILLAMSVAAGLAFGTPRSAIELFKEMRIWP